MTLTYADFAQGRTHIVQAPDKDLGFSQFLRTYDNFERPMVRERLFKIKPDGRLFATDWMRTTHVFGGHDWHPVDEIPDDAEFIGQYNVK